MNKTVLKVVNITFSIWLMYFPGSAFALFEDSEARREIIKLREKIQTLEAKLEETKKEIEGYKTGQISLYNQIEELNSELSRFRGFSEEYSRDSGNISEKIEFFEEKILGLNERLVALEPKTVSLMGQEMLVKDTEKSLYEDASKNLAEGNYEQAVLLFTKFQKKYPKSPLVPFSLHSEGVSYYVLKKHKLAITSLNNLRKNHQSYAKMPEALLTLSAALVETKKTREAKEILSYIIEKTPSSDAALTAKERLKELSKK